MRLKMAHVPSENSATTKELRWGDAGDTPDGIKALGGTVLMEFLYQGE
jgi:hypothetical protein